ncbi:MAG TPA: hypothetical protein PLD10_11895 [Rhodopila sp.]|nr:hypothetical protein [Rhodopila sp.]
MPAAKPAPDPDPTYDPHAIFDQNGPLHPGFMREAIRTLMRALPIDPEEPAPQATRRMYCALLSLAALNPRDEIEVMLAVQALAAYHAAAAGWRLGMNHHLPNGDSTRHVSMAASAARTFDTMLKALERRQAKPLSVPIGRPAAKCWPKDNPDATMETWAVLCREDDVPQPETPEPPVTWTQQSLNVAAELREQDRRAAEDADLDIANTDGILPDGGMIMPEHPTPQQEAYIARRLGLGYRRTYEESRRNGIDVLPPIRPIRPGDLVP